MILYNITIILEDNIHEPWLNWMQNIHIRQVMDTGCFVSHRLLKVLDSPNEGITYCIQYIADSLEDYNDYLQRFAARLQNDYPAEFANKFVSFRTTMEFITAE